MADSWACFRVFTPLDLASTTMLPTRIHAKSQLVMSCQMKTQNLTELQLNCNSS